MAVEAWLERAARTAPAAIAVETPAGPAPTRSCWSGRGRAPVSLTARGAAQGERVAIALPAGLDFACALHACLLLGAVAVPVDLRLGERERAAIVDGAAVVVDEPLRASGGPARGGRDWARGLGRDARPRRGGRGDPHLGHHVGAEAGGVDVRQLPLERTRLGGGAGTRPARAVAVQPAALARRRAVDPAAQRDLRHDGGGARAL